MLVREKSQRKNDYHRHCTKLEMPTFLLAILPRSADNIHNFIPEENGEKRSYAGQHDDSPIGVWVQ